ncbi:MAG: hypothetical protein LBT59_01405 [Clostridiales bacterium]|jgi:hypothetical protein|nr:hypothetical protein [Clostridiales bacterium]
MKRLLSMTPKVYFSAVFFSYFAPLSSPFFYISPYSDYILIGSIILRESFLIFAWLSLFHFRRAPNFKSDLAIAMCLTVIEMFSLSTTLFTL